MTYEETALDNAHKQLLTSADVEAMGYKQIATLAGVTLDPNGGSPNDFFWETVRTAVVNILREEEKAAGQQRKLDTVKAWLTLTPTMSNTNAYLDDQGGIVIK